ncbi:MAG: hypothetical protein D6732_07300 [Methanobacteriota archaeon]|nr:MAG: hypothetical protein D6732_07300 [Euryarchaeota archaeon]
MMTKQILVKLGGSVITEKNKEKTVNLSLVRRAFHEMGMVKGIHLQLIHGAGSFGHPTAKKYDLISGHTEKNHEYVPWAVSVTRRNMIELHSHIVDIALEKSFFPFSLPVSSNSFEKGNGELSFFGDPLFLALKNGFNPVLYGDVILSESRGFTILSGDRIMLEIIEFLQGTNFLPQEIIFCTDVDGFFTDDPKLNPNAKLIPKASKDEIGTLKNYARESQNPDVTKGMLGKLEQIEQILSYGIPVKIINLTEKGRLYDSLTKERFVGTLFVP